jgi:protoheme IX farnesyltransferase
MVGNVAFAVAVVAGLGFSFYAWRLHIRQSMDAAKRLMFASFLYLPLVQIIYVLDKIPPS